MSPAILLLPLGGLLFGIVLVFLRAAGQAAYSAVTGRRFPTPREQREARAQVIVERRHYEAQAASLAKAEAAYRANTYAALAADMEQVLQRTRDEKAR